METSRERFYIMNTMLCLLKTLEGKCTTVELRDEKEVTGEIIKVDGFMNITMKNVKWKSLTKEQAFEEFYVCGKMIRYVHIPDEMDIKQSMERKLKAMCPHTASLKVKQEIADQAWKKMQRKHQRAKKQMEKKQD